MRLFRENGLVCHEGVIGDIFALPFHGTDVLYQRGHPLLNLASLLDIPQFSEYCPKIKKQSC
jgi:hypothetical protein